MAQFSFDIVSRYDTAEATNAVDQAAREINQRYDLKDTPTSVEFTDKEKTSLTLKGADQYQLDLVLDIVRNKFAKRGLEQSVLETSTKPEPGNPYRWRIPLKSGIKTDDAKKITKSIQDLKLKAKTQIQGEEIRVTSASKDQLQAVMQHVRQLKLDFPVQFTNYR